MLFFMDLSTRRVQIGGIASGANGLWMSQIARNLTDAVDRFFSGKRYLIHDRDPLYAKEFLSILAAAGIQSVKLPPRSPNLNAFCERLIGSARRECLDFMIPLNEIHTRMILKPWVAHFNGGRPHSSLGPGMPEPSFPKIPPDQTASHSG